MEPLKIGCAYHSNRTLKTVRQDLEDICQANLAKLASRKERGVIEGEGDNR